MGLGDVKGADCFDALADIMEPALRIANDDDAKKIFGLDKERPEGMTPQEYGMELMGKHFPVMIRKHKDDFAEILAVIKGVSVEEYLDGVTFGSLVSDIMELMKDPVFKGFLA